MGSQGINREAATDMDSFLSPFLPSSVGAVFPLALGSGLHPPLLPHSPVTACRQPCFHPTRQLSASHQPFPHALRG